MFALFAQVTLMLGLDGSRAHANPYLAKPGEVAVKTRIGTCAVTGGFMHLYTALDNVVSQGTLGQRGALAG